MEARLIGSVLGNYRIVGHIGSGAMGSVYIGEHLLLGRRAAIKVLRRESADDQGLRARFLTEVRALQAVGHPHVVQLIDAGTVGDHPFTIMELLEGETLESCLNREHTISPQRAVHIVLQVADALTTAHARGVVHRDIKPDNLFLVERGGHEDYVKVLDFGIAKLLHGDWLPNMSGKSSLPNTLLGTPQYMSPEQCLCEGVDARSDQYSLAVVLYRMVTGQLPFDVAGQSGIRYVLAHVNDPPDPPRKHRPELPAALEAVIMKALAKQPGGRFRDLQELSEQLITTIPLCDAQTTDVARNAKRSGAWVATAIAGELAKRTPSPEALSRLVLDGVRSGQLVPPAIPAAALRCLRILKQPEYAQSELVDALERDPVAAAQVLKLANSAHYTRGASARTLQSAVSRLGGFGLQALLLELSARRVFEGARHDIRAAVQALWDHSVAVAMLARNLKLAHCGEADDATYLAGLLHDVGKPVTAAFLLEAERITPHRLPVRSAQEWLALVSHCHREVGFAMARAWDLPDEVLFAVARSDHYEPDSPHSPVNYVCLANALVKQEGIYQEPYDPDQVHTLIDEGAALFNFDDEVIERALAPLRNDPTRAATVYAAPRP